MNATRGEIIAMIRDGHTDSRVARELRCDRTRVRGIRRSLGVPVPPRQPLTIEQKWAALTRPAKGGHLEWVGERQRDTGTPLFRYKGRSVSPAAIAFRIRHGRDAQGYAYAECGLRHCVAPDHVDDEAARARTREALRALTGKPLRPQKCVHGHDQGEHGRFGPNGVAYCEACKRARKRVAV